MAQPPPARPSPINRTEALHKVLQVDAEANRLVTSLSFSRCGHYLATAGEDDLLRIITSSPVSAAEAEAPKRPGTRAGLPRQRRDPPGVLATYHFNTYGTAQAVFGSMSDHVYMTPRNDSAMDVLRFNAEVGKVDGAYHGVQKETSATVEGSEEYATLVHSPSSSIFAAGRSNGYLSFFHPTVSRAVAFLEQVSSGSPACAFSYNDGQRFCFADKWRVAFYDWRMLAHGPFFVRNPSVVDEDGDIAGVDFNPVDPEEALFTSSQIVIATLNTDQRGPRRLLYTPNDEVYEELSAKNLHYMSHKRQITCTARYNMDGTRIAIGAITGSLMLVEGLNKRSLTHKVSLAHDAAVSCVAWNPRFDLFASSCQTVKLWSLQPDNQPQSGRGSPIMDTAPPPPFQQ